MYTLIAEKPSAGMDLARLLGCRRRHDGYMDGGFLHGQPCRVTWALGHLCQIGETDEQRSLHWKRENLPILPERFLITVREGADHKPDKGYMHQLKIIQELFSTTDIIINCGDAGREGEVIQRWIYDYVCSRDPRCRKPVLRLWVSSLTDEALREGFDHLRPASDYDPLFLAGQARAEADWLVGINATEALTLSAQSASAERRVYSLGRVQTPTLALVCARFVENRAFKPEPFWRVRLHTEKDGVTFHVTTTKRFATEEAAAAYERTTRGAEITVTAEETRPKTIAPPLLYDQTALQQEASRRYDMSPDQTLSVTQSLYEKKLVTYPRTGSRYIPKDVLRTVRDRLLTLASSSPSPAIRQKAAALTRDGMRPSLRSVNDTKVTDHHALLVEKTAAPGTLSSWEQKIYNLIAERMLEAFSPACQCEVTSVRLDCQGEPFAITSTRILVPGWKAVREMKEEKEEKDNKDRDSGEASDDEQALPALHPGDRLPVLRGESLRGETKPKPLYSYETLLEAMENAGRDAEDDEVKSAMKDTGLGTSATRAAIIKNLMDVRKYIAKEGKKIIPTATGLEVYSLVRKMSIADVEMTGRWEIALGAIADGKTDAKAFNGKIRLLAEQITMQLLSADIGGRIGQAAASEAIKCPCCGSAVKVWDTYAKCTNRDCGLSMNRTVIGKRLPEKAIRDFMEKGETGLISGFMSKAGKPFKARLKRNIIEKDGRRYANAELVLDDWKKDIKDKFKKN